MTSSEIVTSVISFIALVISAITAYRTLLARFRGELFMKSSVVLANTWQGPSIVLGCEITNSGAKSGIIEDLILMIKYRQDETASINTYSFLPIFIRDEYSVLKKYQETNLELFEPIFVPVNARLTKYIIFCPSNQSFSPMAGEIELSLHYKNHNLNKWTKASGKISLDIDKSIISIWTNKDGKSISLRSKESVRMRRDFMEKFFA